MKRIASTSHIRSWALLAAVLGLAILLAGLQQRTDDSLAVFEKPATPLIIGEGLALCCAVVVVLAFRRRLGGLLKLDEQAEANNAARYRVRPYVTLFAISFVALFVEVMLIRYCGSQIRIFSFYKNVPLVSCFLGLGLGCCLGQGRSRHVLIFLLWLIPLAVALTGGTLAVDRMLGRMAAAATSEHMLGEATPVLEAGAQLAVQLIMGGLCVVALVAITGLFALLGRLLGDAMQAVPRLQGYTVNILGSLAGIVAFILISYLQTPPWMWFVVGLTPLLWWCGSRRRTALAGLLIVANAAVVAPSVGATVWSRYQKLVGHVIPAGHIIPPGFTQARSAADAFLVQISDTFYQVAVDLSPQALAVEGNNPFPHYDGIYGMLPSSPKRVLIVGAGTGNDVAAALRAGAEHVDAVDIDPAIIDMGRQHHPEHPYDHPRVNVIINDARDAFRRLPPHSYDAVIFGLLDSHTQLSSSSVRLDNYVFTLESFQAAKRLIRPGGHIVVTAVAYTDWFRDRFKAMLEATGASHIEVRDFGGRWFTYVARMNGDSDDDTVAESAGSVVLPTDDWPFLYLPTKSIPRAYVIVVIALMIASVIVLKAGGLRAAQFTRYHAHMFFLGAAFLLMEVHAVNRLALLFGTTWLVSAVTIAFVLILIVCANLTVLAVRTPYPVAYAALMVSLMVSYWLQPEVVLGKGAAWAVAYGLVLLSPIYFAGLIFARSFRIATLAGPALGANIMGSVLGGWTEYATMAVGIRALVLLAAAFYIISLLLLAKPRPLPTGAARLQTGVPDA